MNALLMNYVVRDGALSMKAQGCLYYDGSNDDGSTPSRRIDHDNVLHCMQHTAASGSPDSIGIVTISESCGAATNEKV